MTFWENVEIKRLGKIGRDKLKMNSYVRLNSLLDSKVATLIAAICFMIIIFAMGFCLGRFMRVKKLENEWNKELMKTQKAINEILEKAGISKEISLKRGTINLEEGSI